LLSTTIDFESDVNMLPLGNFFSQKSSFSADFNTNTSNPKPSNSTGSFSNSSNADNLKNWRNLYTQANFSNDDLDISPLSNQESPSTLTFGSALNTEKIDISEKYNESKVIFQVHNSYIISQVKSGLLFVDQQAAHQRILFEKYFQQLSQKPGHSQQCLFPIRVQMSSSDYLIVCELEPELLNLGYSISFLGQNDLSINGTPADMPIGNEQEIFEGIIEQYKVNRHELSLGNHEALARSIAARSGIKKNQKLSFEEMSALINQLFACNEPNYSPSHQRTFTIMDFGRISELFGK
jgi:DNA mismatch repair protein MutL